MGLVRCNECGEMISDVAKTCPNCGAPQKTTQTNLVHCRECGEMISTYAQSCPKCGAVQSVAKNNNNTNKPDLGICILSFLIPLVGIIIAFVKMETEPLKAKEYRAWAVIGTIISIPWQILTLRLF